MTNGDLDTHSRILDAAVRLLVASDRRRLTTRAIAQEAQVNVAAINYHFGSKDELIDRAVEAATASAFEKGMAVLFAADKAPIERLRSFLNGYAAGLVRYSGVTSTAFLALLSSEEGSTFYGGYMKEMFGKVRQVIAEAQAEEGPLDSTGAALMVLSSVIFPFLVSNTIRDAGAIDYANDDERKRYIDAALSVVAGAKRKENQHG